jgi:hypothetical protein
MKTVSAIMIVLISLLILVLPLPVRAEVPQLDISGTWLGNMNNVGVEDYSATFTIAQNGNEFSGTASLVITNSTFTSQDVGKSFAYSLAGTIDETGKIHLTGNVLSGPPEIVSRAGAWNMNWQLSQEGKTISFYGNDDYGNVINVLLNREQTPDLTPLSSTQPTSLTSNGVLLGISITVIIASIVFAIWMLRKRKANAKSPPLPPPTLPPQPSPPSVEVPQTPKRAMVINELKPDLPNENAEQLENTGRFKDITRKERGSRVIKSIGLIVFSGLMWLVVLALIIIFPNYNIVESMGSLIVIGGAVVLSIVSILNLIVALRSVKDPILLAGRTPQETIEQFLNAGYSASDRVDHEEHPWMEGYICLLDQVKLKEGSFDEFVKHMKRIDSERTKKWPLLKNEPGEEVTVNKTISTKSTEGGVTVYEYHLVHTSKIRVVHDVWSAPMVQVGGRFYFAALPEEKVF